MSALLDKVAQYRSVTIVHVDWDTHKDSDIVSELKIPRRSTLVMFNAGKEVARVVARTSESDIEALFKAVI